MTAAIILYDHVNPTGAFDKKSQIDVKGAIKLLQEGQTNDAMLNALSQWVTFIDMSHRIIIADSYRMSHQ